MAIASVQIQLNEVWYALAYNAESGKWEGTVTAPGATSYHQENGWYNLTAQAVNTAGSSASADGSTLPGLRLVVRETVPPVITILSPSTGAYCANNQQPVVFTLTDETGGSGVDLSTLQIVQDGAAVTETVLSTEIADGFSVTYTPASALCDGSHTITVSVSDHDGNAAAAKTTTFTVDTVPPSLNVTAPTDGLLTNTRTLLVSGTTNDESSSPVSVAISLNGTDVGSVTVDASGAFYKTVTLADGENTLVVTATDLAGKQSRVTRTVTLDRSMPQISAASITPNPVDAGATMLIALTVTEDAIV